MDTKSVETLKSTGLFDRLSARECTLLFNMIAISEKTYSRREIIIHEGSEVQHFCSQKRQGHRGEISYRRRNKSSQCI